MTLKERRNRQDIIEVFKMYRGYNSVALNELSVIDINDRDTKDHSCKLKKSRCTRDIVKFFSNKVINRRNDLDQSAVDAPSIIAIKSHYKWSGTTGWASLWISPLSPDWLVKPYMISYQSQSQSIY